MSTSVPFPFDFQKVLLTPNPKAGKDDDGYNFGTLSFKMNVRYKKSQGKIIYKTMKSEDDDSVVESEDGEEIKFEKYEEPQKRGTKRGAEKRAPPVNWRLEHAIDEKDLPAGAINHIYDDIKVFDLESLKKDQTGLRVAPPSEKAEKGVKETKPHLESALPKEQIEYFLEQFERYGNKIYFYPYDENSKNEKTGQLFENWVELKLNKNGDLVKGDWKMPGLSNTELKSANAHFDKWKAKTGKTVKATDSPYEVYRVYVRDQEGQIWSEPLGAIYIRLVRHKATPNRKLLSEAEKEAEKEQKPQKSTRSESEDENSDEEEPQETEAEEEEEQPKSKKQRVESEKKKSKNKFEVKEKEPEKKAKSKMTHTSPSSMFSYSKSKA